MADRALPQPHRIDAKPAALGVVLLPIPMHRGGFRWGGLRWFRAVVPDARGDLGRDIVADRSVAQSETDAEWIQRLVVPVGVELHGCRVLVQPEHGGVALAETWDGASWSVLTTPLPSGATQGTFYSVSCNFPDVLPGRRLAGQRDGSSERHAVVGRDLGRDVMAEHCLARSERLSLG